MTSSARIVALMSLAAATATGSAGRGVTAASSARATASATALPAGKVPADRRPAPPAPRRPNFTGVWVLDMKRSQFGSLPGSRPEARTDSITHREPEIAQVLYIVNAGHRDTTRYHYRTDRAPTVSQVDTREVRSVTYWSRSTLVLDSKTRMLLFEVSLHDRWSLVAGGDTLLMVRTVKSPIGSGDQRLYFGRAR